MSVTIQEAPFRGGKLLRGGSFKVLPSLFYVLWSVTFTIVGIYATSVDANISNTACGKRTHLWLFSFVSTVSCSFNLVTFFIFPGGGEAARARALLITMTHFALAVWGVLMWHSITEECSMFISEHFKTQFY